MSLKSLRQSFLRQTGSLLLTGLLNVLCKTLWIEEVNKEAVAGLNDKGQNYVLAFWHGSMLVPWYLNRNKKVSALISKSKDGDLLAKLLKSWKYDVVRGSSHKGGNLALGIMVDMARNKSTVLVTPDGPRGPAHKLKAGAVITAKKSGVPLVLAGVGYGKKRVLLKSWDKFEIPKMFSGVKVIYSAPVYVKNSLEYEETSRVIEECEKELNRLHDEANKNN